MASFPIVGSAGIDDCSAGHGSCEKNGCGGTCQNNAYQMAWPNFGDCISDSHCEANTNVPYAGGHKCGVAPIETFQKSCSDSLLSPTIKDCGPPANSMPGGYCVTGTQRVIACLNTGAFAALCAGCNPATTGLIGLTFVKNP